MAVLSDKRVTAHVAAVEAELGGQGRVLRRPSGTAPLIRVLVEAVEKARLDAAVDKLVTVLKAVSEE